jgi:hypothetical protein
MTIHTHHRVGLLFTLIIAATYLWLRIDQGCIPPDEGLLGQSAERVLLGELPHVDFDDPYTGGQAIFHALLFQLLGIRSSPIRFAFLVFSVLCTVASYLVASRFAKPWLAALLTLTSLAWSVPNYVAGMPSWYNLFFAMFGTWALVKYDETSRSRWLVVAGVMGGVSFLFKLAGLFFLAAGLLFLVFREQDTTIRGGEDRPRQVTFVLLVNACLLAFVALLVVLIWQRFTPMDIIMFVVPGASLAAFLIVNEYTVGRSPSNDRWQRLFVPIGVFMLGAALPVGVFLVPYLQNTGLPELINGVFVVPQRRIRSASFPLPPLWSLWASLPLALLLIAPFVRPMRREPAFGVVVALLACLTCVLFGGSKPVYSLVWDTARPTIPLAAITGGGILYATRAGNDSSRRGLRRLVFLLMSMAAMVSLVQFPYSFGIYFCYAAPFSVLALASAIHLQADSARTTLLGALCLYLGFALVWLNHGRIQCIGVEFVAQDNSAVMPLSRCDLRVTESQASLYKRVIAEVVAHSQDGDYIYATTDCPEIYFFSGRRNPTRTFYEFCDPDFQVPASERVLRIIATLEQCGVEVVVLHWEGGSSGPPPLELVIAIAERFPNTRHFFRNASFRKGEDPVFTVAWRDLDPRASDAQCMGDGLASRKKGVVSERQVACQSPATMKTR